MSEARAVTNLIGNGVATVALARWKGDLDEEQLRQALGRHGHGPGPGANAATASHL